jgi:hypothetical protein
MTFDTGVMPSITEEIFEDKKRTVTLYRATKTESNVSGSEILAYAAAETVELIFLKTEQKFTWQPDGLVETGDALIYDKANNVGVRRNDKIVVDGETFLIKNVISWHNGEEHIFDAAVGFRI